MDIQSEITQVQQNTATLDQALHYIEQRVEADLTIDEIKKAIKPVLLARSIANTCAFRVATPELLRQAVDILGKALEDCRDVDNIEERFELHFYIEELLDDLDAVTVSKAEFVDRLNLYRLAMDRILGWVKEGRVKFGRVLRRTYFAPFLPSDPGSSFRSLNYMSGVTILPQVASLMASRPNQIKDRP